MIGWLLGLLSNKGVRSVTERLISAVDDKRYAQTEEARIEADKHIAQLTTMRDIAVAESPFSFSATRIGRLLIVVPYGLWWTAIFVDSTFSMPWDVQAIPGDINEMAKILVPAILIANIFERK